jgi:hypothetical protein
MTRQIVCRARLGDQPCYHGRREDPEQPMDDDGTWDGRSVICDACYVAACLHMAQRELVRREVT